MKRLLGVGVCVALSVVGILSSMGCYDSKYYDARLMTKARNAQRADTVNRDLRLIPYDFDSIFGLNYSQNYDDYPRPNY